MRSDRQLIDAILGRDETACQELFERYGEPLRRHLEGMLRDQASADDLLQELLLRVWHRAAQWQDKGSLQSWLFRIATNLALNHIRTQGRRRQQPLDLSNERLEEEGQAPGWLVDEAALGADAVVEQEEQRRLLRGCLETLSDDKREVLRLVYDAEMEVRQVAADLAIPEGTVKSRLYHARRELARNWRAIEREWTAWENEE
jgi:RNA polymerase sigma-70 factor (ECF subfamily)